MDDMRHDVADMSRRCRDESCERNRTPYDDMLEAQRFRDFLRTKTACVILMGGTV